MAGRQFLQRLTPLLANSLRCHHFSRLPQMLAPKPIQSHVGRISSAGAARLMSTKTKFQCINIQDEDDFKKQVIENTKPVIVDFHATWCGPCRLLGPRLESIIASKEGRVILAKVDIDEIPDLAVRFGVSSVPTVVSIKEGQQQGKFIGLQEDDIIDSFIEKVIN